MVGVAPFRTLLTVSGYHWQDQAGPVGAYSSDRQTAGGALGFWVSSLESRVSGKYVHCQDPVRL